MYDSLPGSYEVNNSESSHKMGKHFNLKQPECRNPVVHICHSGEIP